MCYILFRITFAMAADQQHNHGYLTAITFTTIYTQQKHPFHANLPFVGSGRLIDLI